MDKKIKALLEDKAFQKELKACGSAKALVDCFKAHGVDVAEEKAEELLRTAVKKADGQIEFTEEELDKIVGGLLIPYPERRK